MSESNAINRQILNRNLAPFVGQGRFLIDKFHVTVESVTGSPDHAIVIESATMATEEVYICVTPYDDYTGNEGLSVGIDIEGHGDFEHAESIPFSGRTLSDVIEAVREWVQ